MKKIAEYELNDIKSETTRIFYWMASAAKEFQNGRADNAHYDLTTALQHCFNLAMVQQKLKTANEYEDLDIDYIKIYNDSMAQARKEIEEGE